MKPIDHLTPITAAKLKVGDWRYVAGMDAEELSWCGIGMWNGAFNVVQVWAIKTVDGQWIDVDYSDPFTYGPLTEMTWTPTHYDHVIFPSVWDWKKR